MKAVLSALVLALLPLFAFAQDYLVSTPFEGCATRPCLTWSVVLPETPTSDTVTLGIGAFDADQPDECTLTINGSNALQLFGSQGVSDNNNDTADLEYPLPATWFRYGGARNDAVMTCRSTNPDPLIHELITMFVYYDVVPPTPPPPPVPLTPDQCWSDRTIRGDDRQCAPLPQLVKNVWLPDWDGVPFRFPDVVKRRTATTPDRLYWGWEQAEGNSRRLHTNWAPWISINPLTVVSSARRGLVTAADVPLTPCDLAFMWGTQEQARQQCATAYNRSSTSTIANVYAAQATTSAVVGTVPKGASCSAAEYIGAVAGTSTLHWFRWRSPAGFVRCVDTGY